MIVFGGGIGEGEGTRVLRDGNGIIFVEFGELTKFFGGGGIWEECVAGVGVFAGGGVVVELGFETRAEKEEGRFVAFFLGCPFFRRDAGRFFVVGGVFDVFDDARGVVEGAVEGGVVAGFFQELDGEKSDGHVFGGQRDDALGVGGGFGSIAKLEAGFDEGAEDLRAFGGLRIFLEIFLEIADEGGAVVAGGFDSLLEFVGGGELFRSGLSGGGFFRGSG